MFAPVRPKSSETLDAPEQATTMVRACTYLILFGVLVGLLWSLRHGYAATLFPETSSIFKPGNFFGDLTDFYPYLKANDPYSALSVYPPFAFLVMEPFSWIGGTTAIVLWTLVAAVELGTFVAWELEFRSTARSRSRRRGTDCLHLSVPLRLRPRQRRGLRVASCSPRLSGQCNRAAGSWRRSRSALQRR